jgi:hypothetical protein
MFGVFMKASFHCGSNDTTGGHIFLGRQPYRPAHETVNNDLYMWGEWGDQSCRLLTAVALWSCSDIIRIVFSPPMVALFGMLNWSDCH